MGSVAAISHAAGARAAAGSSSRESGSRLARQGLGRSRGTHTKQQQQPWAPQRATGAGAAAAAAAAAATAFCELHSGGGFCLICTPHAASLLVICVPSLCCRSHRCTAAAALAFCSSW